MKKILAFLLRKAVFITIFVLLFSVLGTFFQPVWLDWNNYNTMYGFYEEEENTIDTVFLGSSVAVSGIIPMQLYEEYGICAYNLSTEQQPIRGSYVLLQETYRLHPESLQTVFLEVSAIRTGTEDSFYHKLLDPMPISSVKIEAVMDYVDNDLMEALNYLSPFMGYHTRWKDLDITDFEKSDYEKINGTRGYMISVETLATLETFETAEKLDPTLNQDASLYEFDPEALEYFDRIVAFCEEKGLNLVLFRTPSENWGSSHNVSMTKLLADKGYDIDFLDFNFNPLFDEIYYFHPLDSLDKTHVNYYGAQKMTSWIGNYLVEKCGAVDVRGNEKFAFMEDQMALWQTNYVEPARLKETQDVTEYIDIAFREGYSLFISVRGDAAGVMTDEQRAFFEQKGLTKLAGLQVNDAYLAVVVDGVVVEESIKTAEEAASNKKSISITGKTADGKSFGVTSGGKKCGNTSSIKVNKKEYSLNKTGLNVVVYNHVESTLVDNTMFDLSTGVARDVYTAESVEMAMEADRGDFDVGSFNERLQEVVKPSDADTYIGDTELFTVFERYTTQDKYVILIAVQNEASGCLKTAHRNLLKEYGLETLSTIGKCDAYIGIIDGGEVVLEMMDTEGQYIEYTQGIYSFVSAGYNSGNTSAILVNGVDYSQHKRGINIAVYDKNKGKVVWAGRFDTNSFKMTLPQ